MKTRFIYLPGIALMVFALVFVSCEKDEKVSSGNCNVSDPLQELPWLKEALGEINQSDNELADYAYIMSATYNGQTVFYIGNCHPAVNMQISVQNCEGEVIGDINDLAGELTNQKVLWKHENSPCHFGE